MAHNQSNPLYRKWNSIKNRCYNPKATHFKHYGGRGIKMYKPWVKNFDAFENWILTHLGPCPKGMSIDRIDNDRGYVPGNLKWSTPLEQMANQRTKTYPHNMQGLFKDLGFNDKLILSKEEIKNIYENGGYPNETRQSKQAVRIRN
jgi:hypothetical protein